MTLFGFFLLLGCAWLVCVLICLAIFAACAVAGIFLKPRLPEVAREPATELSDDPVPYWPAEVKPHDAGSLDRLAAMLMCPACNGHEDAAATIRCTCMRDCGAGGCQGRWHTTLATWTPEDIDVIEGRRGL